MTVQLCIRHQFGGRTRPRDGRLIGLTLPRPGGRVPTVAIDRLICGSPRHRRTAHLLWGDCWPQWKHSGSGLCISPNCELGVPCVSCVPCGFARRGLRTTRGVRFRWAGVSGAFAVRQGSATSGRPRARPRPVRQTGIELRPSLRSVRPSHALTISNTCS